LIGVRCHDVLLRNPVYAVYERVLSRRLAKHNDRGTSG
jgi:hypothetical protein